MNFESIETTSNDILFGDKVWHQPWLKWRNTVCENENK